MAIWKYILTPFAASGDRAAIPVAAQPDGSVSQEEGFGIDYQLEPGVDPDAKDVPRDKFNEVIYDTQVGVQQIQQESQPRFITSSDNGGSPYSYKAGVVVRFPNGWAGTAELVYYSLVDANTADPTDSTKWGLVQYTPPYFTGFSIPWFFSTLPDAGWVWANGTTLGNASSGATGRANADTQALYYKLWGDYPTTLPIYTSGGVLTTRGISAAADFAANKALAVPDLCGRGFFGADNMGGITAKDRITVAGSGIAGTTIGAAGGDEVVGLTGNQNGPHTHTGTTGSAGTHTHTASTSTAGAHTHTGTANSAPANATFRTQSSSQSASGTVADIIGIGPAGQVQPNTILNRGNFPGVLGDNLISGGNHNHSVTTNSAGDHTHPVTVDNAGAHTHGFTTASSGVGENHQNMPPAFIGGGFILKL